MTSTEDWTPVTLHKRETGAAAGGYWGHPGICTVTFCEGDAEKAFETLKVRAKAVIAANSWVAGHLDKSKVLMCPATGDDAKLTALAGTIVSMKRDAAVSRKTPYAKLCKATGANPELALGSGGTLVKSGAPVTKLVVVPPEEAGGEFALVFSMSHVAADGHDYYRVYNMLAGTAEVVAMEPLRVTEYEARESEWTGKADFDWLSGGALIKGMLTGLLCDPKAKWCCYFVDEAKVARAKEAAAKDGGVPYVSTNDVLTSHFCRATAARCVMMVINFRDKIAGLALGDGHAGCYEGCLLLDGANYDSAAGVRKCLSAGVPYTRRTPSEPLPQGCCSSCPMAFITSWASFPFELAFDGLSKQQLHLPCMAMPDMMDVAIVFKPTPGKLGMLYLAKRATPDKLLGVTSPLAGTIDDGIFPA